MTRGSLLAAAGGSALLGGVVGALVTVAVVAPRQAAAPATVMAELPAPPSRDDPALAARLDAVERAVRSMELRRALAERGPPSASASASPSRGTSAVVDDPVFEAAVLDVLERAEQGRASERETRRDERRKEQLDRWAAELTRELGLTAAQRDQLLEIRQQLAAAVRQRLDADGGAALSRRERRTQLELIRNEAEQKLRGVLDGRQMRAYEALDAELKIGRGAR